MSDVWSVTSVVLDSQKGLTHVALCTGVWVEPRNGDALVALESADVVRRSVCKMLVLGCVKVEVRMRFRIPGRGQKLLTHSCLVTDSTAR